MKVVELDGGFGIDHLSLGERPVPEPGPYEVLVRLKAASLNYRDLSIVTSRATGSFQLPLVPLSDGVGEVAAVGAQVTRVGVGDRVCPLFYQQYWIDGEPAGGFRRNALGGLVDGVAQEYRVLHEDGVSHVPEHLTDAEAACLPCAGLTAWRALFGEIHTGPSDVVLVQGTGGVSIFALQFAKAAGAKVIITSSADEKLSQAVELGADETVNYVTTPNWAAEARKLNGGRGVDHVIEVGGAETLAQSVAAIRVRGHISLIGVLSGGEGAGLSIPALFGTNGRIQGITVGSRAQFEAMCRAISLHKLRPMISASYPLDRVGAALTHMQAAAHFGKIVVEIGA